VETSERTVAAGAAAPGATSVAGAWASPPTGTGATHALPPSAPPGPAPPAYAPATQWGPAAPPAYAPPPPAPRPSSRTPLIVLAVVLLLAGAGLGIAAATGAFSSGGGGSTQTVVTTGGGGAPTGGGGTTDAPSVSSETVSELLRRYATAYSNEDSSSLRALFAPDLVRRATDEPQMNRSEAIAEYDRQFAQLSDPTYTLTNVEIAAGTGEASASASYEITDGSGGEPATGTIEFHMTVSGDLLLIDALDIHSD
jgi:ketosteroid isomerase-like protein